MVVFVVGLVLGEVLGVVCVDDGCCVVDGVELELWSEDDVVCAIATPVHSIATDVKYANFLMASGLRWANPAVDLFREAPGATGFPRRVRALSIRVWMHLSAAILLRTWFLR